MMSTDPFHEDRSPWLHTLFVCVLVLSVTSWALSAPVVAQSTADGMGADSEAEMFVVQLHDDGSATLTLTVAFDLTDPTEREGFVRLRSNATAVEARTTERFAAVAAATAAQTGRPMSVGRATATFVEDGDVGRVRLSIPWTGFAAVEDGRIVLGPPLSDGFVADRPLVVRSPSGYGVASVSPAPTGERSGGELVFDAGSDLDGLRVTLEPDGPGPATGTTPPDSTSTDGRAPLGVGPAVVAVALLTVLFWRVARRNR